MLSPVVADAPCRHNFFRAHSLITVLSILLLASCRGHSKSDSPPQPPQPLKVTSALPNGRVGVPYSGTVSVSGGTPPYAWSITSGSLPTGLSLTSSGALQGTPSAVADHLALTIQVRDSSSPTLTASTNAVLNISPATISVALSKVNLGLTTTQQASLSATTNDVAGVTWTISTGGPTISSTRTLSGASVTLTAPDTAGVYTVTATSITDGSIAASATVGVTDLAGVYTYHNDLARTGANSQEYLLTPANVNSSSFGKIFSCTVDGAIYAQPLWVPNLTIGSTKHNVVLVATEHNSVYAFDADQSPCTQLWSASLVDSAHGATNGETAPISAGPNAQFPGSGPVVPETGITGTPVIDPVTETLYVVSTSVDSTGTNFFQRLHAIDVKTGAEKSGSPAVISATYPGTGDGGSSVAFNAEYELQRAGLAFVNNTVYIAWASHGDTPPYYGWIIGYSYDGKSFTQTAAFNVAPNAGYGGIWMGGGAPAADDAGNLYVLTGNGTFDANVAGPAVNNDYGDSLLQLSGSLTVMQYFTPSDQALGVSNDLDLGMASPVLVNLPAGSPTTRLIIGGGKDGIIRVLNRDNLGGYGDDMMLQGISTGGEVFPPLFWNNEVFLSIYADIQAYELDPTTALLNAIDSTGTLTGANPGAPSLSANGNSTGIIWAIASPAPCFINNQLNRAGGSAVLVAYDANNLSSELWNSSIVDSDAPGQGVSFAVPTIANGRVYVGTHGIGNAACSVTSNTGELDVYGMK